jgi:hypothetical protein
MTAQPVQTSALATLALSYWNAHSIACGQLTEIQGHPVKPGHVEASLTFLTNWALRDTAPEQIRKRCENAAVAMGWLRLPEHVQVPYDGGAA